MKFRSCWLIKISKHWNSILISCLYFLSTMGSNSKKVSRFHVFSFYGKCFFDWKHSWACRLKLSGCSFLLNAKWQLTDLVADKGTYLKMYPLFVYLFFDGKLESWLFRVNIRVFRHFWLEWEHGQKREDLFESLWYFSYQQKNNRMYIHYFKLQHKNK